MKVTASELRRICPEYPRERIDDDVRVFNEWNGRFGISNPLRVVHFFAQLAHESVGFRFVEENMNYSAQRLMQVFPRYFPNLELAEQYAYRPQMIANRVYANRMGNGDEASGDGWKYIGRGYIQLTGRTNYLAYEQSGFCNGRLTDHPEWLCGSPGRMKSAMWYWKKSGCNALADKDDIRTITKRINGGVNGLSNRQYYYRKAKRILML